MIIRKQHRGMIRGFYRSQKAWYGPSIIRDPEIMIGLYHESDGGTFGEFCIRWIPLSQRLAPQLQVFGDAWLVLFSEFQDLLVALAELDGTDPSEEDIAALLIKLGLADRTPYERGE